MAKEAVAASEEGDKLGTAPERTSDADGAYRWAADGAEAALAPISIGRQPGCGSHRRDCHWSLPRCRHWRCSYRQVCFLLVEPGPYNPFP